ncbi:LysE family translocator [Pseudomonas putida]
MTTTYLSFALAVLLLIASPGPIVAMVIADARRAWPGLTIAGGVIAGQVLLICALAAIYTTLNFSVAVLNGGQVVGGLYLAWLGWQVLKPRAAPREQAALSRFGFWKTMGVGLSNPKDILFFLAFLPGFISPQLPFTHQACMLLLIWVGIDVSILVAYSLLARRLDRYARVRRLLDLAPGIVLLALGLLSFSLGAWHVFL